MSNLRLQLQKGLVGHWTMDDVDTQSGVVRDRSGNGHHAEIRGTPTTRTDSKFGESMDFVEADGDYLPIRENFYTEAEALPEVTISAWYKGTNTGDYIIQYDRSEFFRCTTDVWVTHSDISGGTSDMGYNAPTDGNWHHLVFWYDSDTSGSKKRMYIDTNIDTELSDPHNGSGLGSGLDTYGAIGAFGESRSFDGSDDPRLTGQLSDVRLYERALSESEINALYQMRSNRHSNV